MDILEFRFVFTARDFQQSVDFYRLTLGMEQVGGWDRADGKGALLCARENVVIEIFGAADGKENNASSPAAVSLALRVEDIHTLDGLYNALRAAGCRLSGPPENHSWGHRSFVVYDPDGIGIHYYCEI